MENTHTPGPWRWEYNHKSKQIRLCGGVPRYDLTVMDFVRWGMNGAGVRFRAGVDRFNIMNPAGSYAVPVPERQHHKDWFQEINHPDALLIENAPHLYDEVERLKAEKEAIKDCLRRYVANGPCDELGVLVEIEKMVYAGKVPI